MLESFLSGLILLLVLCAGVALGWVGRGKLQPVQRDADGAVVHPTGQRLVDPEVAADRLAGQSAEFRDLTPTARGQVMQRLRSEAIGMGLGT